MGELQLFSFQYFQTYLISLYYKFCFAYFQFTFEKTAFGLQHHHDRKFDIPKNGGKLKHKGKQINK